MRAWDRLVLWCRNRRRGLLAASAVMTVAGALAARGVPLSTDVTEVFPSGSADVSDWLALSRRFGVFGLLIVGLEEPRAPLTPEGIAALRKVTARLESLKGEGVLWTRSLSNVDSILEGPDGALVNELLMPTELGVAELEKRVRADPQVLGALVSRDLMAYQVLVRVDPRRDGTDVARTIRDAVEGTRGPLSAHYFGVPFFAAALTRHVYAKLPWLVPAFAALLVGVLLVLLGRPFRLRRVVVVLASVAVALAWWMGLLRASGLGLSQTSLVAALVVVVAGAVAFGRSAGRGVFGPRTAIALGVCAAGSFSLAATAPGYLARFGIVTAVGMVAVLAVGLFLFLPMAVMWLPATLPSEPARPFSRLGRIAALALALAAVGAGLAASGGARFLVIPGAIFSPKEEAGQALAFFDRRFGGNDFVQVSFAGDLRDPAVAARLHRLTDLLEGSGVFADVRSVTQVLAFLSHGFGGVSRVPATREELSNIWFFLEGSSDVRQLVTVNRTEAMLSLRIPSTAARTVTDLVATVQLEALGSQDLGHEGARSRLAAVAAATHVPLSPERIGEAMEGAAQPAAEPERLRERVGQRVRRWLDSPDSPYQPDEEAWKALAPALSAGSGAILEVARTIPALAGHEQAFASDVATRAADFELIERAGGLVSRLGTDLPEPFRTRAEGVLAEVLAPPPGDGAGARIQVTGYPVVVARVEGDLVGSLMRAIATLILTAGLADYLATRSWRRGLRALLEAAAATGLAFAAFRLAGFEVDAGSATLLAVVPLASALATPTLDEVPVNSAAPWLLSLAAAMLTLSATGALPVVRIGLLLALGLGAVALAGAVSRRTAA